MVAWQNGKPVRLGDVAMIREGAQDENTESRFNDQRAIILAVFRQPDANTIDVVDQVRAQSRFLPQARCRPRSRSTSPMTAPISIRNAVADVEFTLDARGVRWSSW